MHDASLRFEYDTPEAAALVAAAVSQEEGEIDGDRSRAVVAREDAAVVVDVEADDLVALRAGVNTWGTLLEVAERAVVAGDATG